MDFKLAVSVEQKGIAPTAKNLESLAKASDKAAPAVERLSSSLGSLKGLGLGVFTGRVKEASDAVQEIKNSTRGMAQMAKDIGGLSINLTNIANATDRISGKTKELDTFTSSIRKLKTELEGMKGLSGSLSNIKVGGGTSGGSGGTRNPSVDPEVKAQQRLLTQIERSAMMAGRTKSEYLALRAAQLGVSDSAAPFISRLQESEKGFSKLGMSVKGYNAAMRMVPAQFTDIAVQLAGGQNPMLVLMQQGGQLKDVFGGVGNAMKAVGAQLATYLKNPLLLAAAALTTVVYSIYKASTELDAFNKAIVTTNGIAGISTNTFYKYRDSIASIAGSKSDAAEALTAIAASGKIASKDVEDIGVAAVKMNKATGQAIAETVKDFESLTGKPSEAIVKLNDKYNFLTASVYDQIVALEKQGKTSEASAVAVQAYEAAINNMAAESTSKLGWVLQGWEAIKKAVISVKDLVLDLGVSSNTKQLNLLRTQIDDTQKAIDNAGEGNIGGRYGKSKKQLEDTLTSLVAQRDALKETIAIEDRAAEIRKEWQTNEKQAVDARKKFGDIISSNMTKEAKKQKEINDLNEIYAKLKNKTAGDELDYSAAIAQINEKYKQSPDKSAEKAQKRTDAYEREQSSIEGLIAAEREKQSALSASGDAASSQAAHLATLYKWQEQVAKSNISGAEKKHAESLVSTLKLLVAEEERTIALKEGIKVQQAVDAQTEKNINLVSNAVEAYELERSQITMTTEERAAALAVYNNEVALQKELLELNKARAQTAVGSSSREEYDNMIEDTKRAYAVRAEYAAKQAQLNTNELSWYDNLTTAAKQYSKNLGTYNTQMQAGFSSVISTLESSLTSFVSGTKTSFKDLAVSVLKQIAVMMAKIAIMKVAMAAVGLLSSGATASGTGAGEAQAGSMWAAKSAKGNAFTGTGIAKFAKGGAFSNSVVTSPTAFRFASGGTFNNGLMGEAGPEAVMPLTRDSSGNLAVSSTGKSGVQNTIGINITMNNDGTATSNTSSSNSQQSAKAFSDLIAKKVQEGIAEATRPGGVLATR